MQTITPDLLREMPLPRYAPNASKADYGKLLIIGGSARLPGAALLAARAALRSGCGTVRVAAPKSVASLLAVHLPELMCVPLPETSHGTASLEAYDVLEKQFESCDAVIVGPGLDDGVGVRQTCLRVIEECPLPLLIDASALTALGESDDDVTLGTEHAPRILTPHPGEMKLLTDAEIPPESDLETRETFAREWATAHAATLVLKGRATFICDADNAYLNTAGTRGMGTAGSGDVLTGIIGSFLAQGMNATHAAVWGVHAHALAGERAAQEFGDDGMMASDFLERLPFVLRDLRLKQN